MLIACGIGLLRTSYGDPDVVSDFTPVDTSIKAMIVAAWKRGIETQASDVPVYNCSTSIQRKFTTGFIVEMGRKLAPDVPLDKMIWLPGGNITKCKYNNFIRVNGQTKKTKRHSHFLFMQKKLSLHLNFTLFFAVCFVSIVHSIFLRFHIQIDWTKTIVSELL